MKLRDWRRKNKHTLADLSEKFGVSLGQLSHLELGRRKWPVDLAKRVEAFTRGEVSAAALLGLTERAGRGVREDAAAFESTPALTIEVPISPEQAKLLRDGGIDAAGVASAGAKKALKEAEAKAWAEANREAIDAYNKWIAKHGTLAEQMGLI